MIPRACIIALFIVPASANAQFGSTSCNRNFYLSLYMGAGTLIYPPTSGNLNITFPYTSTDVTGNKLTSTFSSYYQVSHSNPWYRSSGSNVSLEVGTYRYFLYGRVGGNYYAISFSAGAGLNLYLSTNGKRNRCWVI